MILNYIEIYKTDTTNGVGIRVVLWTAGCSHHCKECHNPQTWNPEAGQLFDETAEKELFQALSKPFIRGITFSGGDPLYSGNISEVLRLIKKIRKELPNKDIWLYTGFVYEDIFNSNEPDMLIRQEIINSIDILIDGPFIIDKKDLRLDWRGSSNQRIIDIPKTIKNKEITLWEK